jgi:hypothetical protein
MVYEKTWTGGAAFALYLAASSRLLWVILEAWSILPIFCDAL